MAGVAATCYVINQRRVEIMLPATTAKETRYSFRLNVTVASQHSDIAKQEPWRLTIFNHDDVLHVGESPTPLIDTYYEPEWFYAPGES